MPDADLIGDTIPFLAWEVFYPRFVRDFRQGQHVTAVGRTGSGKTLLLRQVVMAREFVVAFATKQRDDELYKPLEELGFKTVEVFSSDPDEAPRVILKPPVNSVRKGAIAHQKQVFGDALDDIWLDGQWCVFADEIAYLTEVLGLSTEMKVLWRQGRSMGVSIVVATQRPVSIPLEAFSQADHFFFFAEHERDNADRMSEFAGRHAKSVREAIPLLPQYEALYVNTVTGFLCRTKVQVKGDR